MLKTFIESICAGILISIGGSVFLATDNKYIGALFFSVALLCICYMKYYLFTGRIAFLVNDFSLNNVKKLFIGLSGNLISTFFLGKIIGYALPDLTEKATDVCFGKLLQLLPQTFIRAVFCGILMYLAVIIFSEHKTPLGIIFCIPVFILSGFEHSIADMFYFGVSTVTDIKIILFVFVVILGNTVGGMLLPFLIKIGGKTNAKQN